MEILLIIVVYKTLLLAILPFKACTQIEILQNKKSHSIHCLKFGLITT